MDRKRGLRHPRVSFRPYLECLEDRTLLSASIDHFLVTPSVSTVQAGVPFNLTVSALDANNNVIPGYTGTVQFSSSDSFATLPPNYTFQTSDNGVHVFLAGAALQLVANANLGFQTITATDTVNTAASGTASPVNVTSYPSLSVSNAVAQQPNSGTTNANFNVTLSASSSLPVTVNYATADGTATAGTDYVATSGTLTFQPGQTSQSVTVKVLGTTNSEPDRQFYLNLSGASHAILLAPQGICKIPNHNITVSVGNTSVTEPTSGYNEANFTVSLSSAVSFPVTVTFNTSGSSTSQGTRDFVPQQGAVTFAPGQTTQIVSIPVLPAPFVGSNPTFFLNLGTATNATIVGTKGTATIVENTTQPTVSIGNFTGGDGPSGGTTKYTFSVNLSAPSDQTITVPYSTANGTALAGTDYVSTPGTLTFAPGVTSQNVNVLVNGDSTANEADKSFFVNLGTPTNATVSNAQGTGTILNDDPNPLMNVTGVTATPGTSGTKQFNFTVSLSTPATQTTTVQYATADGSAVGGTDYQPTSGTLTFSAGQKNKSFTVLVNGTTAVNPNLNFFVNLSNATNARLVTSQATGTILSGNLGISAGNVSMVQPFTGVTTLSFPVTLSQAVSFPVSVSYKTVPIMGATSNQDYEFTSGTLTFAPGTTSQTVTLPLFGEYYSEDLETFGLVLSNPVNASITTTEGIATITNTTPLALSITSVRQLRPYSGTTAYVFTVALSGAAKEEPVTMQFSTADGTATALANDYQATSGNVTFGTYQNVQTITVMVNGNTNVESDKVFYLNVHSAQFGDVTATAAIVNDDGPF
jgi:hypothetical protein